MAFTRFRPPVYQVERLADSLCIATTVVKADGFWTRLIGLLDRADLAREEGLWLTPCSEIHSFGMRFTFDAVFLDAQGKILHTVSHMPPWQVSPWVKNAKVVLELAAGSIARHHLQVGDLLELNEPSN